MNNKIKLTIFLVNNKVDDNMLNFFMMNLDKWLIKNKEYT